MPGDDLEGQFQQAMHGSCTFCHSSFLYGHLLQKQNENAYAVADERPSPD